MIAHSPEGSFRIELANWQDPNTEYQLLYLLSAYAEGISGGSEPLPTAVRQNLAKTLATRPGTHVLFAYIDDVPAGLAIAFESFSTFACKPILNLHDFVVAAAYRRRGIAQALLAALEAIARTLGCCKVTLECLENNSPAMELYRLCGYASYELDPRMGRALFLEKKLG